MKFRGAAVANARLAGVALLTGLAVVGLHSGPAPATVLATLAGLIISAVLIGAIRSYLGRQSAEPVRNAGAAAEITAVPPAPSEVVGPHPDPRTAIIRCYAAMEHALTAVPALAPHAADSPSDVLRRAVAANAVRPESAHRLVELFQKARFSPHRMNESARQEAETALQLILDDLRSRH
jgi:hypothetical protein